MWNEVLAEHKGWRLFSEMEEEEDNRKIWHYAIDPQGARHTIDFSPYGYVGRRDFALWVDLGRPSRAFFGINSPMDDRDFDALRDIMERFNIPAEDSVENLTRLRITMALYAPEKCYWRLSSKG